MRNLKIILVLLSTFFISTTAFAQSGILHPDDFFPHKLGAHFMPHHLIVDYFQHIGANSDQVIVEQYGETNQNRPLVLAYVSSKENLRNLEQIRKNNLIRTGLMEGEIKEKEPIAIVWLGFGVHGNEAGATNSSIATIYDLANPNNETTQEWLKNTVVIIDPSINPDGYSRYTHWNRGIGNKIANPHIESREHDEPWPGGRVNHYNFDLNRDWAWATQIETQQRLKQYHKWMPHINVDVHEQGYDSPYYFAPAAQPYHAYISKWQADFQTEIGLNHTKYFDKEGWLYFTREVFDLLYPSYGDTYPTFNGAIGMTYEQAGHSIAGRAILIENGDTLKLMDRIMHHKTAALSTVEMGSKNAKRIIDNFTDYFKKSNSNPIGEYKSFIVKANKKDEGKIKDLVELLELHNIEYGTTKSKSIQGFDYQTRKSGTINISDNDLVISSFQPMSVLAQVLFEPSTAVVDSLTYDITAWSLPYAYGLEAYASKQKIDVDKKYELSNYREAPVAQPYAYLARWESLNSVRFLNELLEKGIVVRANHEPFELNNLKYEAGTLVILKIDNKKKLGDSFNEIVRNIAKKHKHPINNATTGYVTSGHDFGASAVKVVRKPRVMVVSGDGVSPNSFGQVWNYFEQVIDMQTAIVSVSDLKDVRLSDYQVLVMPDGWYSDWNQEIEDKIKAWVREGGKLIAISGAVSKLSGKEGFSIKRKETSKVEKAPKRVPRKLPCYAHQERHSISSSIPGAVYKIQVDNTHPLAFGLPEYYFTLKTSRSAYKFMENGWNVGFVGKDPLVSGFVGYKLKEKLEESVSFGVQSMGSGSIVYMVDNPLYRGFWKQGQFIFSNAVFMVE